MVIITVMIYKPWMIFHRLCLHLLDSIDNYVIQILLKFLISTKDNVQWTMMVIVGIVIVMDSFSFEKTKLVVAMIEILT